MLKQLLDKREELQEYLFIRGFLITNSDIGGRINEFPFYSNWNIEQIGSFKFFIHRLQKLFYVKKDNKVFFLIGHAYNPFTMEYEEEKILNKIAESYTKGKDSYFDAVDEITGLFILGYIEKDEINFQMDPSGFQSGYYGKINGKFFISSHAQLIGDICNLKIDPFVTELTHYKWYNRVMGPYLPSDLSPFIDVKRIIPNICYKHNNNKLDFNRFYPRTNINVCKTEEEYMGVIKTAADILKNNMTLIIKKWDNPQISLTGGIDSNTTFAAANGNYDNYETFSYVSAEKETIDAVAASKISNRFNVKHQLYNIPNTNNEIHNFDEIASIIRHNNAYIMNEKDNELRKRVTLMQSCPADVEVKSWGSETIRGYWYKHFDRNSMPRLSGKLYRNLYKIFVFNRPLAHKIDKIFDEYIKKFSYDEIQDVFPPADLHFWEVTWGSWGGTNISEMRICFDITIPYNNRKFLDLMFRVPLDKRIADQHHLDMKKYLNKELYDMNIRVVNMHETKFRSNMLNLIFTINSILPF